MGEIIPYQKKISTIRELLEKSKTQIALALPRHMNADRLMRIAMTTILRNPKLLDCSQISLIGAIIQSAQLGLEPDNITGYAYLVPFKNTVTLIPGYRGLLALARRSGDLSAIYARIVYQKDKFDIAFGLNERLEHIPCSDDDPGAIIGAYAVAHFKAGGHQFEWMWKREIDAIRARSKAATEGPWVTDYIPMALKTVLKKMAKYLPFSVELDTAIGLDDRAEIGLPQDLDILAGDIVDIPSEQSDIPKKKKKLEDLTDQLQTGNTPSKSAPSQLTCSVCHQEIEGELYHRVPDPSGQNEYYQCPDCFHKLKAGREMPIPR